MQNTIHLPQYDEICKLLQRYGVSSAGLFGSRARGDNKMSSDYDILIEFLPDSKTTLLGMIDLELRLKNLLGVPVDVVTKKSVSPYIRDRVFSQVIPFYEAKN
jgi:hypothetical protein